MKGSNDDLGLSAINGVKAISMILIIAGHALVFMIGGPVLNADFLTDFLVHLTVFFQL